MINIEKYDFFIFDCDGVILDSNLLKSKAFAQALVGEPPELVSEFVEYHKRNGGVSRFEKFRYYFEQMKNQNAAKVEIEKALVNFANIVKEELIKCNYTPGVIDFLEYLFKNKKDLYVVSGSDHNELNQVFIKRGIEHYFKKIYGSPDNKVENTRKVVSNIHNSKFGLFFGDSKSDYEAANEFGIDFIFVKNFSEWQDGPKTIMNKNTINSFDKILLG